MKIPSILFVFLTSIASAQCPVTTDPATYPARPLSYPMTSDRYAIQYRLANGSFTSAAVYISSYGGTMASPNISYSKYPTGESLSFASIPAAVGTPVTIRVTKIFGANFPVIGRMSVRPRAKKIRLTSVSPTVVEISTTTAADFAGDQFILYWTGNARESGAIQGLAVFLDPPYTAPTGSNVRTVSSVADLAGDLSQFDTLSFQGTVALGGNGTQVFIVPPNIANIFLAPGSWVQGKLRFRQTGAGKTRKIYGPGVLDGSRFDYSRRFCVDPADNSNNPGYSSISWIRSNGTDDQFSVDGVIISDPTFYAIDSLAQGSVNNLKIIGWNGNNDGLGLGSKTQVSNVFVRAGDDSLKLHGDDVTVTNATVWQNWNGGVVNLGWGNYSTANSAVIDGLYVVKTDWLDYPTFLALDWSLNSNGTNNAVIASLMTPGTNFGVRVAPVLRNVYIEDPPLRLFSLRIMPPNCSALPTCPPVNLSQPSVLNLNLENVFTPQSLENNPIGFNNVSGGSTLPGSMNVNLTNVMVTLRKGPATALTSDNGASLGKVTAHGGSVNLRYAATSH